MSDHLSNRRLSQASQIRAKLTPHVARYISLHVSPIAKALGLRSHPAGTRWRNNALGTEAEGLLPAVPAARCAILPHPAPRRNLDRPGGKVWDYTHGAVVRCWERGGLHTPFVAGSIPAAATQHFPVCKSCPMPTAANPAPNGCLMTVADAMKCTLEGSPKFLCHDSRRIDQPCHGWLAARIALDGKTTEVPWKFSDEYTAEDDTEADQQGAK